MSLIVLEVGLAQQMKSTFTGNTTLVPTCTYLGTYSLSPSSCDGFVLTSSGTNGVRLLKSPGSDVDNEWFMSAVTFLDVPQETGTIRPGDGSGNVLFAMADETNSTVSLNIGNRTSLIPEALNPEEAEVTGFCSLVRFKDPSSGLYLSVDGCDSPSFGLTKPDNSTTVFNVESVSQYGVMPNHEEDVAVTSYFGDSVVQFYFQNPNSNSSEMFNFGENIIYVGLNESDMVIGFICPQSSKDGATIEVQIGKVGGEIDPVTGATIIVLDDVHWLVFGDILGPDGNVTIPKENGLKVVLGNVTGGTELVLPTAQTANTPDNTALTAIVPAVTREPPANTTKEERAMIKALSETVFKMMQPDTQVFWALHMKAPQTAIPGEYQNIASSANQGVGEGGTAVTPTADSPSPAAASSGSNLTLSLMLFVLVLVFSLL